MERNTKPCPVCGKEIYLHARLCPYCQAETKFVSVDEVRAQQSVETADEPDCRRRSRLLLLWRLPNP